MALAPQQSERSPARRIKPAVEGLGIIEASRHIGAVELSPGTRENALNLLGLDSGLVGEVGNFTSSTATAGIGVATTLGVLGDMINLI